MAVGDCWVCGQPVVGLVSNTNKKDLGTFLDRFPIRTCGGCLDYLYRMATPVLAALDEWANAVGMTTMVTTLSRFWTSNRLALGAVVFKETEVTRMTTDGLEMSLRLAMASEGYAIRSLVILQGHWFVVYWKTVS